jgi:hypothetical protein
MISMGGLPTMMRRVALGMGREDRSSADGDAGGAGAALSTAGAGAAAVRAVSGGAVRAK